MLSPLQQQIEDIRANFETRISNLEGQLKLIAGMLGEKLTIELPREAVDAKEESIAETEHESVIKKQVDKIING